MHIDEGSNGEIYFLGFMETGYGKEETLEKVRRCFNRQ